MVTINCVTKASIAAQLTALCALIVVGPTLSCSCKPKSSSEAVTVTMAIGMLPLASLAILADHEGLFASAGVKVNVKKCATGVVAMNALLAGEVPVIVAGDTPIVFGSFKRQDFRIVTGVASWDNDVTIVARKDRGIARPSDLKGKRVCAERTSVTRFFLHMFLLRHGLSEKDVEIRFMPQAEFPQALARGDVDASPIREPFTSQAVEMLGSNAVTFEEPGLYVECYNLLASERFLKEQPDAARRIVRALMAAEAFAKSQPARTRCIVAEAASMPEPTLRRIWPRLDLRVRFSQSLLVALEDKARWAIGDHLVEETEMPNFLRFIHLDTMLAEKPSAVSIIR